MRYSTCQHFIKFSHSSSLHVKRFLGPSIGFDELRKEETRRQADRGQVRRAMDYFRSLRRFTDLIQISYRVSYDFSHSTYPSPFASFFFFFLYLFSSFPLFLYSILIFPFSLSPSLPYFLSFPFSLSFFTTAMATLTLHSTRRVVLTEDKEKFTWTRSQWNCLLFHRKSKRIEQKKYLLH